MRSSASQYCRQSFAETSARLPADRNVEIPTPRRSAKSSTATDSAPDWQNTPKWPGTSGAAPRSEMFSSTEGSAFRIAPGVRADHPHAVGPGEPDQFALTLQPLLAGLGETAGDDHQALDAGLGAVVHDVEHRRRRHRHHGQVDRARHVGQPAVRRDAEHAVGLGVHHVQRPGEAAGLHRGEQGAPDRPLPPAGPDQHHRAGVEQGVHAAGLGAVLAGLHHGAGAIGRVDVEAEGDHAVLVAVGHLVPGVVEDGHHLAVLRQHLGHEPVQPVLPRRPRRGARAAPSPRPRP